MRPAPRPGHYVVFCLDLPVWIPRLSDGHTRHHGRELQDLHLARRPRNYFCNEFVQFIPCSQLDIVRVMSQQHHKWRLLCCILQLSQDNVLVIMYYCTTRYLFPVHILIQIILSPSQDGLAMDVLQLSCLTCDCESFPVLRVLCC